jgi:hypothetical protein
LCYHSAMENKRYKNVFRLPSGREIPSAIDPVTGEGPVKVRHFSEVPDGIEQEDPEPRPQ